MRTWIAILVLVATAAPKDFTPANLGLKGVAPETDRTTGFVIGGVNPTERIRKLDAINGIPIAEREKSMRPGGLSIAGFLGKDEGLLDVMAADNDYVVGELGLTHQTIARHLRLLAASGAREGKSFGHRGFQAWGGEFTYRGVRMKVALVGSKGYQDSPFRDGTKTDTDAYLVNLDSGKELWYSLLVPDMIERYGFYEGKGTKYRVDPKDVVEVLPFLKKK